VEVLRLNPSVEESRSLKKRLLGKLEERYREERAGIHATDRIRPRLR